MLCFVSMYLPESTSYHAVNMLSFILCIFFTSLETPLFNNTYHNVHLHLYYTPFSFKVNQKLSKTTKKKEILNIFSSRSIFKIKKEPGVIFPLLF